MAENFLSPIGRLVQGDAWTASDKDQQGNQRVIKTGPNKGQPTVQYFVAVAFPKLDAQGQPNAEFAAFYALLDRVARTDWPALFPTPGAPSSHPRFTFKVKDGDGVDTNGKPNRDKPGFAGHWVVSFSSTFAPKVAQETGPGVYAELSNPEQCKRGWYVKIAGSAKGNDNDQNPGLYLNHSIVQVMARGEEIVGGPDVAAILGGAPASAMPIGAIPLGASPLAGLGGPVGVAAPAAPPVAPAAPAAPVVPYTGYMAAAPVPGAPAPTPPAAPPAPPVPVGPQMTAAAQGASYTAMIAIGWTDETLRAHGMMV